MQHVKPLFVTGRNGNDSESSVLFLGPIFESRSSRSTLNEFLVVWPSREPSSSLSGGKTSPGFVDEAFDLLDIELGPVDFSTAFSAFSFSRLRYSDFFSSRLPHNVKSTSRSAERALPFCRRLSHSQSSNLSIKTTTHFTASLFSSICAA